MVRETYTLALLPMSADLSRDFLSGELVDFFAREAPRDAHGKRLEA